MSDLTPPKLGAGAVEHKLPSEVDDASRAEIDPDERLLDDFTRLNNELANLQRELVKKNAELSRLNEQKNRFLGMAAHDLASPLGVILNYAEFLELEAELSEEHRDFITTIRDTCRFMLTIVEDLLDVAAIDAGRLDLAIESIDLVALVEQNVALNRTLGARKQIEIAFEPPDEHPVRVDADPRKLHQVLNNLIGNAIKFSQPGASIDVRVASGSEGIVVEVSDNGPGIAAEDLESLFAPFEKKRTRGTAGERGTGLGLAIVRRIVEGHGGTIEVESQLGLGSTFRVTLPHPIAGGWS